MKRLLLLHPIIQKNLKTIALLGLAGLVLVSTVLIWSGIMLFRYTEKQISSLDLPAKVGTLCWEQARQLLHLESWIQQSVNEKFNNLKIACERSVEKEQTI